MTKELVFLYRRFFFPGFLSTSPNDISVASLYTYRVRYASFARTIFSSFMMGPAEGQACLCPGDQRSWLIVDLKKIKRRHYRKEGRLRRWPRFCNGNISTLSFTILWSLLTSRKLFFKRDTLLDLFAWDETFITGGFADSFFYFHLSFLDRIYSLEKIEYFSLNITGLKKYMYYLNLSFFGLSYYQALKFDCDRRVNNIRRIRSSESFSRSLWQIQYFWPNWK